jgi:glycyl-tRNA synthetase beta chain
VYQRGLGSLAEKVERVTALIVTVAPLVGADETEAVRAAELSRCDLLTDMVGEFPELQGIVGSYYAADDGEPKPVSQALRELYLPGHAADTLPETATGQALALADRLDTLAGIFALGKKPTGNRDPFGLRRAALGVVRILVENRIEADAEALYQQAVALQPVKDVDAKAVVSALVAFTFQRMRAWYRDAKLPGLGAGDISAELFESVLARNPVSPLDFHERLLAVRDFSARPEAVSLAAANKRIGNILRSADFSGGEVNPAHLVEPAERALYEAVEAMDSDHRADREARRYMAILRRLAALRDPVDRFFDDVMVMAEDAQLQDNRLALLSHLHALFLDVADLSCLPGK